MEQFIGKSIFDGTAIGKIYFYSKKQQIEYTKVEDTESELARYEQAKAVAIEQFGALHDKAVAEVGEVNAMIFMVHAMMLEDEEYNAFVCDVIKTDKVNAEYAVSKACDHYMAKFANMDDENFKARSLDIKDISKSVISILQGEGNNELIGDEPVIVVADELSPSETVRMDKSKILAFVTKQGSAYSHTAILARAMNIPALAGVEIKKEWNDRMAIVDGKNGIFIVDPDKETVNNYMEEKNKEIETTKLLQQLIGQADETKNGKHIHLYANISSDADVADVLANDAAGIGLFRSEFLYLEKEDYPTEEELFEVYKSVVQKMAGKKVIIRTLDIGADKQAEYFDMKKEDNPALGYRGIRICLDRPQIFKTQLRAIYRAAAYGRVSIMFPMIISVQEVQDVKKICEEVRAELDSQKIGYGDAELGIMIETPAAVMVSDLLAKEVDFFSIGTNDLTQYTLAVDRQNAKLSSIYDPHHLAVLRMIQMVIDNGHKGGAWVGICGELGADVTLTETFVKMGIDELSVSPSLVLPVRKAIREID